MLGQHLNFNGMQTDDLLRHTHQQPMAENAPRIAPRKAIQASVLLRPGNSSERNKSEICGQVVNVSTTGFAAMLQEPPIVGNIYHVTFGFDKGRKELSLMARTVRCQFLGEDSFESGFAFFKPSAEIDSLINEPTRPNNTLLV
jgi:hypothetical protein